MDYALSGVIPGGGNAQPKIPAPAAPQVFLCPFTAFEEALEDYALAGRDPDYGDVAIPKSRKGYAFGEFFYAPSPPSSKLWRITPLQGVILTMGMLQSQNPAKATPLGSFFMPSRFTQASLAR
ncbi:hypothetical protein D3A96_04240 [Robertkochia marina]|nr:hypothetical protein D3A96_04240 [Robertkochia marina]